MLATISPDHDGFIHLLSAAQKSRSVADENGYLDLLATQNVAGAIIPGLDRWLGDDRTVILIADLATGARTCDRALWLNLATMVTMSPSWEASLALRGVRMPTPAEVLTDQFGLARA